MADPSDVCQWYRDRKSDYDAVKERLSYCRNVMLHGRVDSAADMLEKSCVFAVLSIQTQKDRHEDAFAAYYIGDRSLKYACGQTNYGNSKHGWLMQSLSGVDFQRIITILRNDGYMAALEYTVEHFKGLSWVKGAFALAMVGIWELACPDTRTKQVLGNDGRIRTKPDFLCALDSIDEFIVDDIPLFLKQWVMFDYIGGEHSRHMIFYREVLPNM
jgi:hypothetical protein